MAVVALTSAKGSPGVTTTALALTVMWPSAVVLVEADAAASSSVLTGYFRGQVEHSRGLVEVAKAAYAGDLDDRLPTQLVPLSDGEPIRALLPGLQDAAQTGALPGVWPRLASALGRLAAAGTDAIVDAGRLGALHGPLPLLRRAELVLLTLRPDLPSIAAARAQVRLLREQLTGGGQASPALGLLLIDANGPYAARSIAGALGLPVLARLPWDPAAAAVFSVGASRPRRFETLPLVRGAATVARQLRVMATEPAPPTGRARHGPQRKADAHV